MEQVKVSSMIETKVTNSLKGSVLEVGQILWYGAKASEKPNYGKNSKKTPLTPVVLTLISKDDLEMKKACYSDK
jgi:hypothetical protein